MLVRAASHLGAALFYKIFYKFFCKNLLTFANSFAIITHVVRSKHPDDASCGGLAQLGERLHGMQEVTGSIPVFSTISYESEPNIYYRVGSGSNKEASYGLAP